MGGRSGGSRGNSGGGTPREEVETTEKETGGENLLQAPPLWEESSGEEITTPVDKLTVIGRMRNRGAKEHDTHGKTHEWEDEWTNGNKTWGMESTPKLVNREPMESWASHNTCK